MRKLLVFISVVGLASVVGISAPLAGDPTPCKRKEFKTELVKKACTTGGQKAAKDVMKKFTKDAKAKHAAKLKNGCMACHSKTSGDYPLKPGGMALYTEVGGK